MLVDFNPLNALIYLKDNVVALVYSSEEGMNSNMNIVFFLVLTWRIDRTFNRVRQQPCVC